MKQASLWRKILWESGRILFGIVWIAVGAIHFVQTEGLTDLVPEYMPVRIFWVWFTGTGMILAGVCMLMNRLVRFAATILVFQLLLFVLQLHLPLLLDKMYSVFRWTRLLQDLTLLSFALIVLKPSWARLIETYIIASTMFFFGVGHTMNFSFVSIEVSGLLPYSQILSVLLGFGMVLTAGCIVLNFFHRIALTLIASWMLCFITFNIFNTPIEQGPVMWIFLMIQVGIAAGMLMLAGGFVEREFERIGVPN